MNFRLPRRVAPAALVATALVGALATAAPADAAAPPFENGSNHSEVGTITFYDASGAVITGGSANSGPFAAYAVGSVAPRVGDTQAQLLFANPESGTDPAKWYAINVGPFSANPISGAPSAVQTASSGHPTVVGSTSDNTPEHYEGGVKKSTVAGYTNVIQVRLRTANASNQITTTYDVADIQVDPAAHTWTQVFPVVNGPVKPSVSLTATPNPATVGTNVTLTATESPATAGSVQFEDGTTPIGAAAAVDANGVATTTTSGLAVGSHSLTAVFTPTDTTAYSVSTSAAFTETVNAPAAATSLAVAASPTSVNYGSGATIAALLKSASGARLGGQTITLKQRATGSTAFKTVKSVVTSSAGAASVTVKPTGNTQYQWTYAGTSAFKASTSAVAAVTVSQVLAGAVNHTSIKAGTSVDFYGAVAPVKTGTKVYLQVLTGKKYVTSKSYGVVKKQKLPNGKTGYGYVIVVKLTAKKTYTLRAYVPSSATLHFGISPAHKVKVV